METVSPTEVEVKRLKDLKEFKVTEEAILINRMIEIRTKTNREIELIGKDIDDLRKLTYIPANRSGIIRPF